MLRKRWQPVVAAFFSLAPVSAAAQVDYRNLDDGRPTRVADAYPIERFAFELSVPERMSWNRRFVIDLAPELAYGVARSAAIGVVASFERLNGSVADDAPQVWGGFWAMANLRRETPGAPALSFRVDARAPLDVGGLASTSVLLTALGTRSIGRMRIHANAGWRVAEPNDEALRADGEWWLGLAVDRTLWRTSTLLIGELVAERAPAGMGTRWEAGIGVRRQLTPIVVLAAGVAQHFGPGADETAITVAVSRAFGLTGLMPGRAR